MLGYIIRDHLTQKIVGKPGQCWKIQLCFCFSVFGYFFNGFFFFNLFSLYLFERQRNSFHQPVHSQIFATLGAGSQVLSSGVLLAYQGPDT